MNISKISLNNYHSGVNKYKQQVCKPITPVVACQKQTVSAPKKTVLAKALTIYQTLKDRLNFYKHDKSMKTAELKDDMLNPILKDTIAKMNDDIYYPSPKTINGFDPVYIVKNDKTGFYAVAYKQGKEVIITYSGTNNAASVVSDVQMALGKIPSQFKNAEEFYKNVKVRHPDCDITLTGHSLGGSLAQLMSCKYKHLPSITLNAFGTDTLVRRNKEQFKNNHNIYNYIIKGDFVANSAKQIGKTVMLDQTWDVNGHEMPNFVDRWA